MENQEQKFKLFKVLRAHLLPLTNCAFNKAGDKFITGSYDRTCKVWDTESGAELLSLEEHKNVVYTMAFNNPFGNLIVTGSFDRTAKIWIEAAEDLVFELLHNLEGHRDSITSAAFSPDGTEVVTGSHDKTLHAIWLLGKLDGKGGVTGF